MTAALPAGWVRVSIDELTKRVTKGTTPTSVGHTFAAAGVRFVKVESLARGKILHEKCAYIDDGAHEALSRSQLAPDDVLYSIAGTLGRVAIVAADDVPANTNQALAIVRLSDTEMAGYIARCLTSPLVLQSAGKGGRGVGLQNLNLRQIRAIEVPLAPLGEQRRIVEKIEALMARSRRAKEALNAIPPLLERFRQSVLAAAFRGDLTAEWRAQNPDVEPADQLLERIRVERRRRWEEGYLEKQRAKGKEPKNDKWKVKYKEPTVVTTANLPLIPRGWSWARLEAITPADAPIVYGIVQPGPHVPAGIPFVRPADITDGTVIIDQLPRTSIAIAEKYARAALCAGDLVFSIVGTIGKWTVADRHLEGANITQSAVRIRPAPPFTAMKVLRTLQSPVVQAQMARLMFGNAVQRLNVAHMRELVVPVPPADEWTVLEDRLERAFESVAILTQETDAGTELVSALDRAVLARAFRGELVPQDPNDEPASVLLERIRAERAAAPPKKKRGRSRKAAK